MKKEYISLEIALLFMDNMDVITTSDNDVMSDDIFDD